MNSILISIKKMLGLSIEDNDEHFDSEIIAHINSVFLTLHQLGIGPIIGFTIEDSTETWGDFMGKDILGNDLNPGPIKTYIYLKVRLIFDPPTSSFVLDAMERQINEFEWRLNIQAEGGV